MGPASRNIRKLCQLINYELPFDAQHSVKRSAPSTPCAVTASGSSRSLPVPTHHHESSDVSNTGSSARGRTNSERNLPAISAHRIIVQYIGLRAAGAGNFGNAVPARTRPGLTRSTSVFRNASTFRARYFELRAIVQSCEHAVFNTVGRALHFYVGTLTARDSRSSVRLKFNFSGTDTRPFWLR